MGLAMPNPTNFTRFLADQLMTTAQIGWMLFYLGIFVMLLYVFGFIAFVRWGNKMNGKRARDIELARLEAERERLAAADSESSAG